MANVIISDELKDADTKNRESASLFFSKLSQIAGASRRSIPEVIKEMVMLRCGSGRLSFDEYMALRLYDNGLYRGADKKAFAGLASMQNAWVTANYRYDLFGLMNSKIATDIILSAYGFPVLPSIALYRAGVGRISPLLLRDEDELRAFLSDPGHYPLFSKPVDGQQGIGTASLARYDARRGCLVTTVGQGIALDVFLTYVKAHADAGYLFQRRMSPHTLVKKICGDRLATVRLLTIITKGEPKILRACWKIPAGINIADNFWRSGNLLAQLDLNNGRVLHVIRRNAEGFDEVTHHPDTKEAITGMCVPNWQEITALALDGAKVMKEMALTGWDIAPVDSGAVVVEVNETPDFNIHQLADRRGILNTEFRQFLAERKRHAAGWLLSSRQKRKVVTELVVA